MPAGQPFTRLCQQLAQVHSESHRADLHLHTSHSDGTWSAAEVVDRAARRGLGAIAVTDHDTLDGYVEAQAHARKIAPALTIIAGVEISCRFRERSLHLLGYFVDPTHTDLQAALRNLRVERRERFRAMADRLTALGVSGCEPMVAQMLTGDRPLGRRDMAELLVAAGLVRNVASAFHRFLKDGGPLATPLAGLPVDRAIETVHAAGGVCSWAHPPEEVTTDDVRCLADMGIDALEAEHPAHRLDHVRRLRQLAKEHSLAVSGGSDCHGPIPLRRAVGSHGIIRRELDALQGRCGVPTQST